MISAYISHLKIYCFKKTILINAYALTKEKDDEKKEEFYSSLEDRMDTTVGDVKTVLGEFNAKISKEALYRVVIRTHSLHEASNDDSMKLVIFSVGKGLCIKALCSHTRRFISTLGYPLMENIRNR